MENISFNSPIFPDPYKLEADKAAQAAASQTTPTEERGTYNARTVVETLGAGGQIDPGLRPFKRKNLLTDYKVTKLKKIKLIVKYTIKDAKKGAKIGAIAGLVTGGIKALFTGNLLAIPVYGGLGAGIGGAITGTGGAIKGIKTVRNLTPQGLIEEKIKGAQEDVDKAAQKAKSSLMRAHKQLKKLNKLMPYLGYSAGPLSQEEIGTLRTQVRNNVKGLTPLQKSGSLNKEGKKNLQALRKLQTELDIHNTRHKKLEEKARIRDALQNDLALMNESA